MALISSPNVKSFGSLLRELRVARGLTIANLANTMGWSSTYLTDIELGRRNPPSIAAIKELAKILGVSPGILIEAAARSGKAIKVVDLPSDIQEAIYSLLRKAYS